MSAFLEWWPVVGGVGTVVLALGALQWESRRHSREIAALWKVKSDEKEFAALHTKVEGIDRWSRDHEKEASDMRLKIAEQMSAMQKSIELANSHRDELVRVIERIEVTVDKVDKRVEEIGRAVTEFMLRKGWETKDR